jgi:hypothetical protein
VPALLHPGRAAVAGGSELQVSAAELAASNPADLDEVGLDQVDSASADRAASVAPDVDDSAYPVWAVAPMVDLVFLAWAGEFPAGCHRDDFRAGCNPADSLVRKAADCSRAGFPDDSVDDNFVDDSANRRDSPDGWTI